MQWGQRRTFRQLSIYTSHLPPILNVTHLNPELVILSSHHHTAHPSPSDFFLVLYMRRIAKST